MTTFTWEAQTNPFGGAAVMSVFWSAEQQLWVATAGATDAGQHSQFATSVDGINWIARTSPLTFGNFAFGLGYSPLLNQWLIAATAGLASSPDGITWTDITVSNMQGLEHAKWYESQGLWIVAGDFPNGGLWTSTNGTSWTMRNPQFGVRQQWDTDYSVSEDRWVVVGDADSTHKGMSQSSDAFTWTQVSTHPSFVNLRAVCYNESLSTWLVAGGSYVATSSDGLATWTSKTVSMLTQMSLTSMTVLSAEVYNGEFTLGVGYRKSGDGFNRPGIVTSTDGINWSLSGCEANDQTKTKNIFATGYDPTHRMRIAVGGGGFPASLIYTSVPPPVLASMWWSQSG